MKTAAMKKLAMKKNPKATPLFLFAAALMALALPLAAQTASPGRLRLNLDALAKRAKTANQVTLDGSTLRALVGSETNQQAASVLAHLKGVYVRDLEFARPGEYSPADLRGITAQLAAPGWHTIVHVRDTHEHTWIAVRHNREGIITALAILDAEPTQLTVVNIVGPLPKGLASLSALGGLGNLGKLGSHGPGDPAGAGHPRLKTRSDAPQPAHP